MPIFIDSDVLFEILRGEDHEVLGLWDSLSGANTAMLFSSISEAEIWAAARSAEHVRIMRLFRPMLCVSVDREIGKLAGEYLRKFGASRQLKLVNALIAASAFRHQAALWTRNRGRYPVEGITFYT
jgi:predicted nucleic acid-binding protein